MKFIKNFKKTDEYVVAGWTRGVPQEDFVANCYKGLNIVYTEDTKNGKPCYALYVKWSELFPLMCKNRVVAPKYKEIPALILMMDSIKETNSGVDNCYIYWDMCGMNKLIEEVACQ